MAKDGLADDLRAGQLIMGQLVAHLANEHIGDLMGDLSILKAQVLREQRLRHAPHRDDRGSRGRNVRRGLAGALQDLPHKSFDGREFRLKRGDGPPW